MLDFYEYAELLLETLASVGDFLLSSPAPLQGENIANLVDWLNNAGFPGIANWLSSSYYPDITIAAYIFGTGMITFLVLRLIKAFTNWL